MSYLDLADRILAEIQDHAELADGGGKIDGRPVHRVIWETSKMVVFEDSDGHFWRYLHEWGKSWPVVIEPQRRESH